MPYISKERRAEIARGPGGRYIRVNAAENAGELNFIFSYVINAYLNRKGVNYQHINDCIGALAGAKMEFNRRVVVPYENQKIEDNGDVYSSTEERAVAILASRMLTENTANAVALSDKNKHGDTFQPARFCGANRMETLPPLPLEMYQQMKENIPD